jgi:septal ring factor EnvC (AmiA/AmiB activator)
MTRVERESINFKLPKTLADALRDAAKERNTTATDLVIRGLHHILGSVPGVEVSTEIRLQQVEEDLYYLAHSINSKGNDTHHQNQNEDNSHTEERLTKVEEKLETLNNRVAKLEGALTAIQHNSFGASNTYRRYKNSGNPYNQSGKPPQIEALDEQKLALRLNVNIPTLKEKHETLSTSEFGEWSKNRDRAKYMWRFNQKDGLYHPVK